MISNIGNQTNGHSMQKPKLYHWVTWLMLWGGGKDTLGQVVAQFTMICQFGVACTWNEPVAQWYVACRCVLNFLVMVISKLVYIVNWCYGCCFWGYYDPLINIYFERHFNPKLQWSEGNRRCKTPNSHNDFKTKKKPSQHPNLAPPFAKNMFRISWNLLN